MSLPSDPRSRLDDALCEKSRTEVYNLLMNELALPLTPVAARNVALLLNSRGWHKESLPYFQAAISGMSPEIDSKLWRIAEGAVKKSTVFPQKRERFWRECNSPTDLAFEAARRQILLGSAEKALQSIGPYSESLFPPEHLDDISWCLGQLATAGKHNENVRHEHQQSTSRVVHPVFVAGTGWSGSGAIYDFLSEFESVIRVKGEGPPFSLSSHSLYRLREAIMKSAGLRPALIGFFFENVLGFSLIRHPRDLKAFHYARQKTTGSDSSRHFTFAREFCNLAAALLHSESQPGRLRLFDSMIDAYISSLVPETEPAENQTILFDNAIPLNRLQAFSMLESGTLIGSVRDARSIYADRRRNDPRFSESLTRFIGAKLFSRIALSITLRRVSRRGPKKRSVFVVQFEEFVSNDSLRQQLINKLRLDPQQQDANSQFHPGQSQKNIELHKKQLSPVVNGIIWAALWGQVVSIRDTRTGKSIRPHCRLPGQLRTEAELKG